MGGHVAPGLKDEPFRAQFLNKPGAILVNLIRISQVEHGSENASWFRVGPRQVTECNEEDAIESAVLALRALFLTPKTFL